MAVDVSAHVAPARVPPDISAEHPMNASAFTTDTPDFTVGVEEELMLLDPTSLDLSSSSAAVLRELGGDPRYHEELPASQLELTTPVCNNALEIHEALLGARRDLLAAAGPMVRVAAAGTHPFAKSEGQTGTSPRYRAITEEYQWAARRGLAWGLHVHVSVGGVERAVAVHDAIRAYLPELAALAGNSPFHEGRDTGLHSVRPKLAEGFPRQGIPPAWGSWSNYSDFLGWGSRGGAYAEDGRQLWWEVRLHPGFGTIEVRACDQPTTAAESAALASVVQALCRRLAGQSDAGELGPTVPRERIEENRWRALRHGLNGSLLDYRTGEPISTRARVEALLEALESYGVFEGRSNFAQVSRMLESTGSERQRSLAAAHGGDLNGLMDDLARLVENEVEEPPGP